ncbi:hypothetical protein GIB67_028319 [Kingdonia uniflora]|uniref:No apical meristem-associated C-terminal domain-containing protein n=1 Tax=Kingdonia uniflora TaxID=39325 RepID=A0A7J7MHS9_9MAGN|nr:hypothetical protein GIB67_028319 [Kingdonia uniflora]
MLMRGMMRVESGGCGARETEDLIRDRARGCKENVEQTQQGLWVELGLQTHTQNPHFGVSQQLKFECEFAHMATRQSDANASIPVKVAAPQNKKGKERKKRAPAKQKQIVQVPEDAEFLDETDDAGMHWTEADLRILDPEYSTRRLCGSTKSQWYALNAQCVAYKGIVAQERFRNSSGKIEEDRENDAHKIYRRLNGNNDFKHREAYKILAREPRWDNLRDDGLNHAVNIPRNVARRTSDNSSPGNSVGLNNLSEDPDGPPAPQSAGPNFDLDGSLYEGRSRPIGQKLYRKNLAAQKTMDGVAASGNGIQTMLDELRLEKIQAKEEKERKRA